VALGIYVPFGLGVLAAAFLIVLNLAYRRLGSR